jgi:hypothetical protein
MVSSKSEICGWQQPSRRPRSCTWLSCPLQCRYWVSKSEKKGANPFKDPLAIIGIVSILFPFVFVLIAIGSGAIDTSVYR